MEEEINLNKTGAVYIIINGSGTNHKNKSEYDPETYQILEVINYNSNLSRVFGDIRQTMKDAKKINNNEELTENSRLKRMCELIKFYLLYTPLNVIIIGNSHGALIIHGAILKLKMNLNDNLNKELNSKRIYIITNGSPRYLPKELLEKQQIYNVYNVEDTLLNNKLRITSIYFNFPNLKDINHDELTLKCDLDSKSTNPEKHRIIKYKIDEKYIYVKNLNITITIIFENHTSIYNISFLFNCERYLENILFKNIFGIKTNIKEFDRKLYLIGLKYNTSFLSINQLLDKKNIELLSDKDIFQLYYSFNPKKDKQNFNFFRRLLKKKIDIEPKTIKVDNIKDKLNFLSIKQLEKISGKELLFSNPFEFIQKYNNLIENIKEKEEIDTEIALLEYLHKYNRRECIEYLKLKQLHEINENISNLDKDIKISIFYSLSIQII